MQVQPYLFFNGRCEEAADFYRRTIGAEPAWPAAEGGCGGTVSGARAEAPFADS
jgi:uncharacterized glyoxalase superfamily protein PhnB